MTCNHFKYLPLEPIFLFPQSFKIQWTCLYDGCIKIKKRMSRQQLIKITQKLTQEHKIMINCQNLQIYCTECKRQIYDTYSQAQDNQSKDKKKIIKHPIYYREKLVQQEQAEGIFAANMQYPLSFQKEKRGFCGLKANAINSYLNSIIQLLATIPIFQDISAQISLQKVQNKILSQFFKTINAIWSGKYRIYKIEQLQKELMKQDNNFKSYKNKNPQQWLYFILKKIQEQFSFNEVDCNNGSITSQQFQQWKSSHKYKNYSLFRQIFGGACILEKLCKRCNKNQFLTSNYQWLMVDYEKSKYHDSNVKIQINKLIDESFNWKTKYDEIINKMQKGTIQCKNCNQKIKQYYTYVHLPNHLIIELGQEQQGINVTLPDQIDLSKHIEQNVKKIKEESCIYQYLGSIFRRDKKYITHLKHYNNKKEYNIINQNIIQSKRITDNTKIALYKRRSINQKNISLYKNIVSCLEVKINPIVPLPDFWSLYLKHHYAIPPLLNPFVCTHGKLKNNYFISKNSEGPQRIPIEVYSYLLQIFGGRKIQITHQQDYCQICIEINSKITNIRNSERQMASFADKLSHNKDRVLIDRTWLGQWRNYIYQNGRKGYRNHLHKRPKAIRNDVQPQQKMKKISPQVWYFLQRFYGGGPLNTKNAYHPNVVLVTSVNLRLEAIKSSIKEVYGSQNDEAEQNIKSTNILQQIQQLQEND